MNSGRLRLSTGNATADTADACARFPPIPPPIPPIPSPAAKATPDTTDARLNGAILGVRSGSIDHPARGGRCRHTTAAESAAEASRLATEALAARLAA